MAAQPMDDGGKRLVKQENKGDFKVIVAIDFGTHGTGMGYAIIDRDGDEKEPQLFIDAGCANADNKNKTDILLSAEGKFMAFGETALEKYMNAGDEEDSESEDEEDEDSDDDRDEEEKQRDRLANKPMLFESFKMALYEEKESSTVKDGDIRAQIASADGRMHDAESVFIAALEHMRNHIFESFRKNKVQVKDTATGELRKIKGTEDIQWLLTVPAIWSDRAKWKMERWALKAGLISDKIIEHLRIVYEPDCASISCQYEAADEVKESGGDELFGAGERYVLIDAGGGTVDIACHQVRGELEMEEVYRPTGGPWGSDYIDTEFDALMDEIFGAQALRVFREYSAANYTRIKDNFRKSKMNFYAKTDSAKFHKVQLTAEFMDEIGEAIAKQSMVGIIGGDDIDSSEVFCETVAKATPFGHSAGELKMEADTLLMSAEIWKECLFDKVIDPMVRHVQDLIAKVNEIEGADGKTTPVKYLCIAGGLSSSKYFQHRIHDAFGMEADNAYQLSIRIPRRPILSVIDGALRLGLRPSYIKTRRVKYTYGIAVDRSEKNVDVSRLPDGYLDNNVYVHPNTNKRIVRNLFSAFIKKNEAIDMDAAIEKEYRRFHPNEKTSKISLYFSDLDDPYVIGEDQQPLASVTIDFPDEYNGLKFIVKFFFGDTKLRAKVEYRSKKQDQDQTFTLKDLVLDFHDFHE